MTGSIAILLQVSDTVRRLKVDWGNPVVVMCHFFCDAAFTEGSQHLNSQVANVACNILRILMEDNIGALDWELVPDSELFFSSDLRLIH
jgi:hypothetical protein